MSDPPLIWLCLLLTTLGTAYAIENRPRRTLHVLAGGHLRLDNDDLSDAELLTASASGSKDKKKKHDDEERKTLSQQVADGRYGLIQKELFGTPHKKPGVVSYDANSEVPKDNAGNLGGLDKNEIWLAENHLLVVRGGVYPPHDDKNDGGAHAWPAIDDYKAPKRPVKLPAHPKVPPPFPVQLTDDGPLQILGTNSSRTINGTLEKEGYPLSPPEGYVPGTGPFFPPLYPYPPNASAGQAPYPGPPLPPPPGDSRLGAPFPPLTPLNGSLPPYFASLPPGAVILPPPNNLTDQYDEDDPSIYYPPPYSFYYPRDNSTEIRAGPLVPGIILPPPPDFFAPLEETTTERPTPKYKIKTTTKPMKQIRPTTTPVPITSVIDNKATKKPTRILPVQTPSEINNELKPLITTLKPVEKIVTVLPVRPALKPRPNSVVTNRQRKPQPGVTILKPIITKPTSKPFTLKLTSKPVSIEATPQPEIYIFNNEVTGKPFAVYGPPYTTKTTSSTQLPIKIYYTTSNEIETNSVTDLPIKFQSKDAITPDKVAKLQKPQNYYYYEQKQPPNSETTPQALQELQDTLYNLPRDYYNPTKRVVPPRQQPRYYYATRKPYNTQKPRYQLAQQAPSRPDSFKVHIARLQNQIQQYYTTQRPYRPGYSPKPVYQFSFQAANYQPEQNQRPVYSYQQQIPNEYNQQQLEQHRDFRTPQPIIDDPQDKFRPIPHYSVQIQAAVDVTPTEKPIYKAPEDYYRSNSGRPIPSRYYNAPRPGNYYNEQQNQQYNEQQNQQYNQQQNQQYNQQQNQQYNQQNPQYSRPNQNPNPSTPRPISEYSFGVTPNPIYQGFYTKPDETYFDDQTKKYFTIFGKKIPNATTPLPQPEVNTRSPIRVANQNQARPQPQQQISLAGDTLVNYLQPRPSINPDAELIEVNPKDRRNYPRVVKLSPKPAPYIQARPSQYSTNSAEIVKAIPIRVPESEDQTGSFISYELPGDNGAHFYFLTPQLANRRDQGAKYFYSQPDNARRSRRFAFQKDRSGGFIER